MSSIPATQLTPLYLARDSLPRAHTRTIRIGQFTGLIGDLVQIINEYLQNAFTSIPRAISTEEAQKFGSETLAFSPEKQKHLKALKDKDALPPPENGAEPYAVESFERYQLSATQTRVAYTHTENGTSHFVTMWDMASMSSRAKRTTIGLPVLTHITRTGKVLVVEELHGGVYKFNMSNPFSSQKEKLKTQKQVARAHIDENRGRLYLSYMESEKNETQIESFDMTKYKSRAAVVNVLPNSDAATFQAHAMSTNKNHLVALYSDKVDGRSSYDYVTFHAIQWGNKSDEVTHLSTFKINNNYETCALIDNRLVLRTRDLRTRPSVATLFDFDETLPSHEVDETAVDEAIAAAENTTVVGQKTEERGCVVS